jgi:hypothetical protein
MQNTPSGKTFLVSNRFDAAQSWGTPGEFLEPAFTVEDMFNST